MPSKSRLKGRTGGVRVEKQSNALSHQRLVMSRKTAEVRATTEKVVSHSLAGPKVSVSLLGIKAGEIAQLVAKVRQGFSYQSLERFIERTHLPKEDAIGLVNISPRTMHRRKETGKLSSEESDRLVRAARIIDQTRQLFENDVKAANRWLSTPQPALLWSMQEPK